ncbi:hypothetical protein [Citrifermentans bremense]|uniref:hypothetical protein n=1 Tax=Citrifermentans bremense TaxID=60035 RepID=UPI00041C38B1|nr:hypothetical protein [Citrifermentans bremense]
MSKPEEDELQIACQQILLPDASVFSVQWVDLPLWAGSRVCAKLLLEQYFKSIRRCTLGLVRPAVNIDGVHFRVMSTRFALLSFEPARYEADGEQEAVHLYINGGFLVQAGECGRGMFSLLAQTRPDGLRVTVELSDYCPLLLGSNTPSKLRKLFYGLTQSYFHKVVTVKYLSHLYRFLTGAKQRARVKKVQVRQGTDI